MSEEYKAAIEKNDIAIKAFKLMQQLYRSRQIGDVEFLSARKAYDSAMAEFDIAFAKERQL